MPTTNIDQRVKRVAGLSNDEVAALHAIGAENEDDLKYIQFVDLPNTVPLIKRRKLEFICKYLAVDNALNATTTMDEVRQDVNTPAAPVRFAGHGPPGGAATDPSKEAPKVYTDPLADFSGDAIDYEDWARKAGATIK